MPDEELVSIKVTAHAARFLEITASMLRIDVPKLVDLATRKVAEEMLKEIGEVRPIAQEYLKVN